MAAYHHLPACGSRRVRPARVGFLALAILYCIGLSPATADEQRRRIYFLESLAPTQPAAVRTIEAFRQRLAGKTTEPFEIFIDYMELERFPSQAHIDGTVRFLQGKYAEAPPDVLIPLGRAAVPFMLQNRKVIAPNAPVIMTSVPARATGDAAALGNTVWVVTDYDFAKTLAFAHRLQPNARDIVVIGGRSDYDRQWLDDARRDLQPYRGSYEIKFLVDLPYRELLAQVSQLSPDSIVLLSFVFKDGDGLVHTPPDVAEAVARVSAAPVYSPVSTFFSRGIVGGYMDSYEGQGVVAADLALQILSGKSTGALDRFTRAVHQYHADARQLDRWGLAPRRLPPDTIVAFQQPSVWNEHRSLVIATAFAFILQSGLLTALLIHRRRIRLAELRLSQSENRLLATAASANVGLWQLDRERGQLWMTEHCRKLFALPRDAPLTRHFLMATIHPEDRGIASSLLQATADPGAQAFGDIRIVAPDRTVRWIRIRTRLDSDERNTAAQVHGIFMDITQQKLAEAEAALRREEVAQLRRVREREGRLLTMNAMSASIAHEISQPIGAMMAGADAALIWLGKTPPELANVRSSVERIAIDGRRASDVVASVRRLFRRDGVGAELIDANDLVGEVLAVEHDELQRHRITVETDLATATPVSFDRTQLHQVVLNLVTNAMEAMSAVPDRPRVLRVRTALHGAGEVVIAVEDSGTGIDRDGLEHIFEPFFTTKTRGMGLGLWLCRRIVEYHHGRLTATSDVGRGSRFQIVLPYGKIQSRTATEAFAS